jgi:hypothetical protein
LSELITACRDALADQLDREWGHLMIEPELYERDARSFLDGPFRDIQLLGVRELGVVARVEEICTKVTPVVYIFRRMCSRRRRYDNRKDRQGVDSSNEEMAEALPKCGGDSPIETRHPSDYCLVNGEPQTGEEYVLSME